jgi:hypothetical protein
MSAALAAALTALGLAAAALLLVTARRNRALRERPGNVRAFVRHPDRERWLGGHGVWVNDVFAFRRSPAGWEETLLWVASASARAPTEEELARLRRIEDPVVVTFALASGGSIAFAARAEDRAALVGPFA